MADILITGSNGFIGHELCHDFDSNSIGYYRLSRSGNVSDNNVSLSKLPKLKTVIHLAGLAHKDISKSSNSVDFFNKSNVEFTLEVAKASYKAGASKFIFMSSIGVYGLYSSNTPINENFPLKPTEPYAVSKLHAELELIKYFSDKDVQLIILRPSLVYGNNPPGNLQRLYNLVCTRLPMPFLWVNNKRSMLNVRSLCNVIHLLLNFKSDSLKIYNVSDSDFVSTFDLISCFKFSANSNNLIFPVPSFVFKFIFRFVGRDKLFKQLFENFIVDNQKLIQDIGWLPEFNTLERLRGLIFEKK